MHKPNLHNLYSPLSESQAREVISDVISLRETRGYGYLLQIAANEIASAQASLETQSAPIKIGRMQGRIRALNDVLQMADAIVEDLQRDLDERDERKRHEEEALPALGNDGL